jgi:tripartite-type tricarboxylate transporter receptor subunit TctC
LSKAKDGMRRFIGLLTQVLSVLCCASSGPALAQAYPAKTVRWIVPFPAGGGTDIIARTLAQKLTEAWGQQVIVDNRPGSGGTLGLAAAAKSPADGYTLALAQTANVALAPAVYASLPYDPQADFAPVTLVLSTPFVLVAHPSVPAKNARELVALARARPDDLSFGSSGNGTLSHLAGEMIKTMGGVRLLHVPYKGVPLATADLYSGRIALYVSPIPPMLAPVRDGRLKAIGVTGAQRSNAFPGVPTLAESGLPGYEATNWYGVMTPARTPRDIVVKLNAELTRILQLADVKSRFQDEGGEVTPTTPEQFAAFIARELPRWAKIVKASGARVD